MWRGQQASDLDIKKAASPLFFLKYLHQTKTEM